ncbi:hypothetical protein FHR36_006099 [Kitasatospora paracochleata]|uniref:Uncharacterized protein n=1 Tax=Kitasatospora paracochleata TaxID=58354 RepID=A0ABT1J699_9ACTN|nr:hypothetical protein [Kitasatospora paracochleata]
MAFVQLTVLRQLIPELRSLCTLDLIETRCLGCKQLGADGLNGL